ncbi:hypothetical protein AB4345_10260 [Vibrio breoganii]|uniref:hypothetical protein n=1 Tax=Vibrio breoganii TaxID=553239 RepID=UPI000C83FE24|nr:hypothetical protein [Vibrio breoganii]PML37504.1 hypothetical protein BCT78_07445 [Vibrio breoganii]
MLKDWVYHNRKDLLFIVFCWFIVAIFMFTRSWESISNLELNDNDDYMRYVQFMDWIKYGNWYLEPMPRFNPEDGVIMHWSRIPDLLLAGTTLALSPIFGINTASLVAIGIVPLFYMLCFSLSVFAFVDHYLGEKYRFIGMIFALGSHAIAKFYPGSIDHHNLQLIIIALFLAVTPLDNLQASERFRWLFQSFLIALSMWIGLDNFIFFVLFLATHTLYFIIYQTDNDNRIPYLLNLCMCVTLFGALFSLLNRPLDEFLIYHYDALSIPFISCFMTGSVILYLTHKLTIKNQTVVKKLSITTSVGLICSTPLIIIFPELIQGAYSDYPPLIKEYWLDNVNEVQSMYSLIKNNGLFSLDNFLLFFIPSFLYPFISKKIHSLNIIYSIFILHLLLSFFWQIRAINTCFVLSAPLQVFVLYFLADKVKNRIASTFLLISGIPVVIMLYLVIFQLTTGTLSEAKQNKESKKDLAFILNEYNISDSKILSGVETGAKILAKTSNSIIAAPYHRNIPGNSLSISTFLSVDEINIKNTLKEENIDYIIINRDNQLKNVNKSATDSSFIKKLNSDSFPVWIERINKEKSDGYQIFIFKG